MRTYKAATHSGRLAARGRGDNGGRWATGALQASVHGITSSRARHQHCLAALEHPSSPRGLFSRTGLRSAASETRFSRAFASSCKTLAITSLGCFVNALGRRRSAVNGFILQLSRTVRVARITSSECAAPRTTKPRQSACAQRASHSLRNASRSARTPSADRSSSRAARPQKP